MADEYLMALAKGHKVNQYEIIKVLGAGGFGVTYLARDTSLDKLVAIKEYMPSDFALRADGSRVTAKSTSSVNDYQWGLSRFLEEARVLAKFHHPNIIEIHQIFEANETAYIVMEYAEGETLSEHLERVGILNEAGISVVLGPILDGLLKVHELGFLHRDIKPGNIVLRASAGPVLLDFGAARQALEAKSRSITSVVTEGYAPIEQYASNGHQGPWTDIYALGAVSYRCLTGETPPAATMRIRNDPMRPATAAGAAHAETQFLAAIDWALSPNEADRPQTIGEWVAALQGTVDAEKTMRARRVDATMRTAQASHALTKVTQNLPPVSAFPQPVSHPNPYPVPHGPTPPARSGFFNRPLAQLWPVIAGAAAAVLVLGFAVWWFVDGRIPQDDRMAWNAAMAANTTDGYRTYIALKPAGFYVADAQERIDEATSAADDSDWAKAASLRTSAAYQAYMQEYPTGRHLIEAKTAEVVAEHNEQIIHVQQGLTMAGFYKGAADGHETTMVDAAIRSYQQSKGQAVTGTIDATLISALDLDNAAALQAQKEAQQREANAYSHALAVHDRPTYETFVKTFPQSVHLADVRQRLTVCHMASHMVSVAEVHDVTGKASARGTGDEGCHTAEATATQQMAAQCQSGAHLTGVAVVNQDHDTTNAAAGSSIFSSIISAVTKKDVNVNLPSTCSVDMRAHCALSHSVPRQYETCG